MWRAIDARTQETRLSAWVWCVCSEDCECECCVLARIDVIDGSMRHSLAAGALVALAAAAAAWYRQRQTQQKSFTVLAWNLLASEFTSFNHKPPGCVQGHLNPEGNIEMRQQTAARYSLASDAIIARQPDAVLLQECSREFFDIAINPKAGELLDNFKVALQTNSAGPGTAVLLRLDSHLVATGVVMSAGADKATGGTSKSSSAVLVTVGSGGPPCWLVSMHATPYKYAPDAVREHLRRTGDALRVDLNVAHGGTRSLPRLVVGGDFNAEPHEVATLQREMSWLGGALSRVIAPGPTGLSANFSTPEAIDHFFVSAGLKLLAVELERAPASPYGTRAAGSTAAAPVIAPSDHVWQSIRVAVD